MPKLLLCDTVHILNKFQKASPSSVEHLLLWREEEHRLSNFSSQPLHSTLAQLLLRRQYIMFSTQNLLCYYIPSFKQVLQLRIENLLKHFSSFDSKWQYHRNFKTILGNNIKGFRIYIATFSIEFTYNFQINSGK